MDSSRPIFRPAQRSLSRVHTGQFQAGRENRPQDNAALLPLVSVACRTQGISSIARQPRTHCRLGPVAMAPSNRNVDCVALKRSPREAISTSIVQICQNLHARRKVQTSLDFSYEGRFFTYAFIEVQGRVASKAIHNGSATRNVYVVLILWNLATSLEPEPKIRMSVAVIEKIAVHLAFTGWCRLD
jgi:hypothetical protein